MNSFENVIEYEKRMCLLDLSLRKFENKENKIIQNLYMKKF